MMNFLRHTFPLALQRKFYAGPLVLAVLLAISCVPDPLEVDGIPSVKPRIVVSTQMITGESLVVLLTKTFAALDASEDSDPQQVLDQIAVNDAVVSIGSEMGKDTLISLGNGFYGGVFIPFTAGRKYTLHVNSVSLGRVEATAVAKEKIDFDYLKAELHFNGFDDTLAQITYRLKDPSEKNWYMLNVQHWQTENWRNNILNPRAFTRLVNDESFNGTTYGEEFRVFPRDYQKGDTIAVSLSNISEEYNNFMQLRMDNRFSFIEFISEPVNYPTNVTGGRGFFNLYIPDVRVIVLE